MQKDNTLHRGYMEEMIVDFGVRSAAADGRVAVPPATAIPSRLI